MSFVFLAFCLIDGQVDPMLFSLVRKDLSQQGPRHMVLIGDKMVDYNEKFRLFFSTRNPHVRGAPTRTPHALLTRPCPHGRVRVRDNQRCVAYLLDCILLFPQPILPPSASSIVAEVNFAVTRSGLEGQLLGVTLQFEQPELEKQKSEQLRREEEVRSSCQFAHGSDDVFGRVDPSERYSFIVGSP